MTKITAKQFREMKPKKSNKKEEESIQVQIAKYLRTKYPNVPFSSDFAAGCRLTIGQASRNKSMQCGLKMPDMFIAQPNGLFNGMYLELKKSNEGVYLKDGTLSSNAHIQEQDRCHSILRGKGYYAAFACGLDNAINQIEHYLSRLNIEPTNFSQYPIGII